MMRLFSTSLILAATLLQSACTRCVSCTITDSNGNEITSDERTCGNRQQLDDARAEANIRGKNVGGAAICIDAD